MYPDHSILFGISGVSQFIDLNSTGTEYAGDEGFWDSSGALPNVVSSPAAYEIGDWIHLSLSIRFDGSNYTATYSATLSDSDGADLGAAIMEGAQIFTNSGLSSSGMLYPFFYFDGDSGSPTIDTVVVAAVPEPSTTALILGGAGIIWAILRRRRA